MNKSVGFALVGLAVGLVAGGLIARARRPDVQPQVTAPPPPPVAVRQPEPLAEIPDPEVERLRARVAVLEAQLKEKPAVATAPPEAPSEKPTWMQKLSELLKTGAAAYKSAKFQEMVADLKGVGKEAIQALGDKLLHAESAGERFLAAALLEELDDPSAIPALTSALQNDEDPLVRRMSSHAIALIENEAGLPALRSAMAADTDWGVRVNSAYGVAKLGQADGVKTLEDAYKSAATPAEHKLAVLGGLADVAAPSSAPIFKKILAEATDISYLYVAISAAQKLNDVSFLPDLNRIAADTKYSSNVREFAKKAAEALSK
jgi:HEAT repeat protein